LNLWKQQKSWFRTAGNIAIGISKEECRMNVVTSYVWQRNTAVALEAIKNYSRKTG